MEYLAMWDIGVDVVEVKRFRQSSYKNHKVFYEKIFTPGEILYCVSFKNSAQHFAATFAGKEAVYKAIYGHVKINLNKIEIVREGGVPKIKFLTKGNNISEAKLSQIEVKISLSHSFSYAVAFAFALFKDPENKQNFDEERAVAN
jgi:holo-[acyl-carrier protein] synthase